MKIEHFTKAIFESVVHQARNVIEETQKELEKKFKILRVHGGASQKVSKAV